MKFTFALVCGAAAALRGQGLNSDVDAKDAGWGGFWGSDDDDAPPKSPQVQSKHSDLHNQVVSVSLDSQLQTKVASGSAVEDMRRIFHPLQ
mmetsp:Transcript_26756/g.59055  ORF Transcript_26756/g.59055 Transcript_26756/m.59055 type:complete len:91 (-) Transcript_26756:312-584(-)|eukprot:CAMPEP_0204271278 /NCGR_PEP_ID=MMETSP0468-20130131/19383_1 /ASSEMBLY_ACC=CAM_ASM_000383 /TAXON_ID=2969 /ORGANISM="Oxyrrhis marina" /LENGTH=90 /DNA_ID=CAMNT_0051246907 /DNA_START=99 /DNA_END=371 /DNA_ORIENTATION=+